MSKPPNAHAPLVRSNQVVRDIGAAVNWIEKHSDVRTIALVGWATGGLWAGYYASLYSEKVSHLVLYNTLYGGTAQHHTIGA